MREKVESFLIYGPMVAVILLIWCCCALGQTPTPVPFVHAIGPVKDAASVAQMDPRANVVLHGPLTAAQPGYWLNSGYNAPCPQTAPGVHPFVSYQEPVLGITLYFGGDVNVNQPHPQQYGTYIDAIYYNHTHAYYDFNGIITPMQCENCAPNFYPAPTAAAQLCVQWGNPIYGNTAPCPFTGSYSLAFSGNQVWTQSLAFYQPQINAACNGTQPTPTKTPTLAPTLTPTPSGPTPTPGPNQFQDWIYQVAAEKLIVGCSPTLYCPGDNTLTWQGLVTRAQQAVYMLKAEHGASYVPPKCVPPGSFTDVPCVH